MSSYLQTKVVGVYGFILSRPSDGRAGIFGINGDFLRLLELIARICGFKARIGCGKAIEVWFWLDNERITRETVNS